MAQDLIHDRHDIINHKPVSKFQC